VATEMNVLQVSSAGFRTSRTNLLQHGILAALAVVAGCLTTAWYASACLAAGDLGDPFDPCCGWEVRLVHIDADVNRDANVQNDLGSSDKVPIGIFVVANKDGVYADEVEPARRREIWIWDSYFLFNTGPASSMRNPKPYPILVRRSSDRVRLFPTQVGGQELFGGNGKTQAWLPPGKYWLEGGESQSTISQGDWLDVSDPNQPMFEPTAGYSEKLSVTVVWVTPTLHCDASENIADVAPDPVFDKAHYQAVVDNTGLTSLGVKRGIVSPLFTAPPYNAPDNKPFYGGFLILGSLGSTNMSFGNGVSIPVDIAGHIQMDETLESKTWASLGFVWRRTRQVKYYVDGGAASLGAPSSPKDDSPPGLQDVTPDPNPKTPNSPLLISDFDAPYLGPVEQIILNQPSRYFSHLRANFSEHAVFYCCPSAIGGTASVPERCSAKTSVSVQTDQAVGYDGKAVAIFDPANGYGVHNVVSPNPISLDLNLPGQANITQAYTDDGDPLYAGQGASVVVKGDNLCGKFLFVRTDNAEHVIHPLVARVKVAGGGDFSSLNEVTLGISVPLEIGATYKLVLINALNPDNDPVVAPQTFAISAKP
jgi:hypothetical protein